MCIAVSVEEVWTPGSWRTLVRVFFFSWSNQSGDAVRKRWTAEFSVPLTAVCLFSDLEQLDVSSLCDGVVRFLQDLPGPVLPSSLQADMIHAVQGQIKADPDPVSSPELSSVHVGRVVFVNRSFCPQRSGTWRTVPRYCGGWPARRPARPSTA